MTSCRVYEFIFQWSLRRKQIFLGMAENPLMFICWWRKIYMQVLVSMVQHCGHYLLHVLPYLTSLWSEQLNLFKVHLHVLICFQSENMNLWFTEFRNYAYQSEVDALWLSGRCHLHSHVFTTWQAESPCCVQLLCPLHHKRLEPSPSYHHLSSFLPVILQPAWQQCSQPVDSCHSLIGHSHETSSLL